MAANNSGNMQNEHSANAIDNMILNGKAAQQSGPGATSSIKNGEESSSLSCSYYYLTAEAAQAIPNYQYKGEDLSLLYAYILSPLAQVLVERCTPSTMAPNTITSLGLGLMTLAYIIFWWYAPLLQVQDPTTSITPDDDDGNSPPRWIFLYNAIAMFIYQTLDNMDGKQARKTKSSSPMGLLFDHGCDAINSMLGSANWIVAMGLNPFEDAMLSYIILVGPYALFYIATWEEYYTGELILPIFNGPNEGLLGGALLSVTTYVYGPEFWVSKNTVVMDSILVPLLSAFGVVDLDWARELRNADLLVIVATLGFVHEMASKTTFVMKTFGRQACLDILPFYGVAVATLVIGYCDKRVWSNVPRTSLHLISCLVVEMVTALMLAHISAQKFEPFQRWINAPLFVLAGVVLWATLTGQETPTWTSDYLIIYTTAACTFFAMKVTIIIDEICRLLNIWCFDIVTPRPPVLVPNNLKKIV